MPPTKLAYTITSKAITVVDGSIPRIVSHTSPNYNRLAEALRMPEHDLKLIRDLADLRRFVAVMTLGEVQIANDEVRWNGQTVQGVITDRLLEFLRQGYDLGPLSRFLARLMKNPSEQTRNELYLWLEAGSQPMTDDGCFLAFKAVRPNYTDKHTGTMDNSVGQVPSMKREDCDPDRNNECSRGLHFCAPGYLSSFAGPGDPIMIVKVDPGDVVAIPKDYSNQKGRAWRYEVVGQVPADEAAMTFFGGRVVENGYYAASVGNDRIDVVPVGYDSTEGGADENGVEPADVTTPVYQDRVVMAPVDMSAALDNNVELVTIINDAMVPGTQFTNLVITNKNVAAKANPSQPVQLVAKVTPIGKKSPTPFMTSDGRSFTTTQIKKALKDAGSVRSGARSLLVPKSTFQGWVTKINS